jgi:drug/metabolite transporter (DMT)-like permease
MSTAEVVARLSVVLAATCYAFSGIFNHGFYAAGGEPLTLVALRFIVAAIVFASWTGIGAIRSLRRRDLLLGGAVGVAQLGFTICLVSGFEVAPVSLVVLLFYTYPLLVTIGANAFFGERLTSAGIGFVVVGSVGLVLAIGTPGEVTWAGIALGLGAGLGNAAVILGNRVLLQRGLRVPEIATMSYSPPALLFVVLLLAGAISLPPGSTEGWASAMGFAVVASVLPYVLFYRAVAVIGAGLTALLATLEPFVAVLLAFVLLGERLNAPQLVGGGLILTATTALAIFTPARRPAQSTA